MRIDSSCSYSISTGDHSASAIADHDSDLMDNSYERDRIFTSFDGPRPCYYMLRLLGVWQPRNCLWIWKLYNVISFLVLLASLAAFVALDYLHVHAFRWEEFLNTCGTCLDLGCPFLFTKYYLSRKIFEELLSHVIRLSASAKKSVHNLAKIYTALSTLLWLLCGLFFYVHWRPFFYKWWHHVVYSVAIFYATGFWASWLSLYGFVCHVHRIQVLHFQAEMNKILSKADTLLETEKECITSLLIKFHTLEGWLNRSQRAFSKIISFCVAYHIADMFVFSVAYFRHDFGRAYPIWQYAGTMLFDLLSILIKLFPAAALCQALHDTMIAAGGHCMSSVLNDIPYSRITFYQFLFLRDQDVGFRILGVKITSKLTVGIFVTIATGAATFLRFYVGGFSSA